MKYLFDASGIVPQQLHGFFDGWSNPPSPETHLAILRASTHVVLALADDDTVAGFTTAISDGVLSAYISLLEVRKEYRGGGVGTTLMRKMLDRISALYMVDLICDAEMQPFYEKVGLRSAVGAVIRNYSAQAGRRP